MSDHTPNRIQKILHRYGWRAMFLIPLIGFDRLGIPGWMRLCKLRLLTRGSKGSESFIGRHVVCTHGAHFRFGRHTHIGDSCTFEIHIDATEGMQLGDHVWLSNGLYCQCSNQIKIGNHVIVGEYVSIRDSTHDYSNPEVPILQQEAIVGSIHIHDNVWIGRGTLIQGNPETTVIGEGAIIGANSLVKHSIPPYEIWAGAPARLIKKRLKPAVSA